MTGLISAGADLAGMAALRLELTAWGISFTILAVAVITGLYVVRVIGDRPPAVVPACPWCDDRTCGDSRLCDCIGPCGRMSCKAPAEPGSEREANLIIARWAEEGGRRDG